MKTMEHSGENFPSGTIWILGIAFRFHGIVGLSAGVGGQSAPFAYYHCVQVALFNTCASQWARKYLCGAHHSLTVRAVQNAM